MNVPTRADRLAGLKGSFDLVSACIWEVSRIISKSANAAVTNTCLWTAYNNRELLRFLYQLRLLRSRKSQMSGSKGDLLAGLRDCDAIMLWHRYTVNGLEHPVKVILSKLRGELNQIIRENPEDLQSFRHGRHKTQR